MEMGNNKKVTNYYRMLTKEELILGYKKILKHPNPEEQVEEIMA